MSQIHKKKQIENIQRTQFDDVYEINNNFIYCVFPTYSFSE